MAQTATRDPAHATLLRRPRPSVEITDSDYTYIFHTWMGNFATGLTPEMSEKLSDMLIKLIKDVTPMTERKLVGEFFDGMDNLGSHRINNSVLDVLKAAADLDVVFFITGRLMGKLDGMDKKIEYENLSRVREAMRESGL